MTSKKAEEFSLLGGPFHRLRKRLGLGQGGPHPIRLGLAIGGSLWAILIGLHAIEGTPVSALSAQVLGGHVRFLVAVPLFFWCEALFASRPGEVLSGLVRSQVVPVAAAPAFNLELARISRWKDSWLPELACLAAAVLLSAFGSRLDLFAGTAVPELGAATRGMTLSGLFYWLVCLPTFRYLLFRWLWRLGLWSYLLWRLSRLKLALVPTHPDGMAGLGTLDLVNTTLVPLVFANSAVQAASFAEEISGGTMAFEEIYPALVLILFVDAVLFVGPLFLFAPALFRARGNGLLRYMPFASRYVNAFDQKWIEEGDAQRESPLGTADLQSLADLNNSVRVITDLRLVPVSRRLLLTLAVAAVVPMLPLMLLVQPASALAQKLVEMLLGM
ncbi:MAG: Uncharacterized protein H6Q89_5677 [Myxococcaceae bacterium]|nr:Uncharacterized protein [Myxococcaceae bacterium]